MADDIANIRFGADGIRGLVGECPFTLPSAMRVGQALGQYLSARSGRASVVIGYDPRPSGPGLVSSLASGLMDQGADVVDLGVMTTPGVAFLTRWIEADLGVSVSASHSSYEYNGFKLVNRRGLRLPREDEVEIEELIRACLTQGAAPAATLGQETPMPDLIDLYIEDHVRRFQDTQFDGLRLILDCAEGAAARVAPHVFQRLGAQVTAIHAAGEGININHLCGSEHVHDSDLKCCVQNCNADYGFAFDGDGDRLVVVDAAGRTYDGYDLLYALARHFHEQGRLHKNTIVTDFRANLGLEDSLLCHGIKTVYTENGDRNLEAEMWSEGYFLGGESGGNVIVNDNYHTAADAVYAALVLSQALVESRPATLSDLVKGFKRHPQAKLTLDLQGHELSKDEDAQIEQWRQRKLAELAPGSRILIWKSSTEAGRVRVLVEGTLENRPEQVVEIVEWLAEQIRDLCKVDTT
jgi:phosphoglucosamine mutase